MYASIVTGSGSSWRAPALGERPRLTWRQDLITVLLATVMEAGGILDGWAHSHVPDLETVLTPWHGVLYGGYVATAGWIGLQVLRYRRAGRRGLRMVPVGYGLGVVGVVGWNIAGILDLGVWHQVFGIEQGIEALLSPTHLLLAGSELLIITRPLRAAWAEPARQIQPLRTLVPAVWSAALGAQLIGFMLQYEIAFVRVVSTDTPAAGVSTVLVTNAILIGTMLLLLRRLCVAPGGFTLMYTGIALMLDGLVQFAGWPTVLAALTAGAATDVIVHRLRGAASGLLSLAAAAVGSSLVLWVAYLVAVLASSPSSWSVELWGGAITLAVASSIGLALLAAAVTPVLVDDRHQTRRAVPTV